ncbi:hypothetical protein ENUP19_0085G0080 [Entamoeba nuttalli]|uniref:SH3 domain containing protein n=2 Tax=Entamoeba nuttalli TaxID=412467 RepID=K2H7R0_ENTNP|nr:SH3 domain containing protein [Entamoeba nuttalli P19]EKE38564.1 SH3 domain containing protein [Entamoeba nuttalli P19]|eukprot:XP_008859091.1 SH3 domain containing protein [Entamoeba nuttalli P19]
MKTALDIVNRKIYSASKSVKEKRNEEIKEVDEEFETIDNEFKIQQCQFQHIMNSLSTHLNVIRKTPQSLLKIGDSFLQIFNQEDDIYNHVLQFNSSCQIRQMAEYDYATAYEILYSNAHSCIIQYNELEDRKKIMKDRKIDWELSQNRVREMKKKKNQKGIDELLEKEEFADVAYHELRNELIQDMCLMMNMVVKYRSTLFRAVVELEMKKRDGVNEALSIISKFGGEQGAAPQYVITEPLHSYISELHCYDHIQRRKHKITTSSSSGSTSVSAKHVPEKTLPKTPSKPSLMSQEMKLKNEIINGIKKEIEEESQYKIKKNETMVSSSLGQSQEEKKEEGQLQQEKEKENNDIITHKPEHNEKKEQNPFDSGSESGDISTEKEENKTLESSESSQEEDKLHSTSSENTDESSEVITIPEENKNDVIEVNEEQEKTNENNQTEEQNDINLQNNQNKTQDETKEITQNSSTPIVSKPEEIPLPNRPILSMKALYDYEASDSTELSLREGDIINIYDNSGDWWMAELNGKRGLVPANFIDYIK